MNNRFEKNIVRLLLGQLITVFGSQIYTFALSYYVLKSTGSGIVFGMTLALGFLPQLLFSPFAGVLADSFSRKKVLIYTDLISGIVLIAVFGLSKAFGFNVYYIYILMFVLSVLSTFNDIALNSAIPNIVEEERLSWLNSMSQSIASFARITAPFIGGLIIIYIDIEIFLIINAISFIMASFLESKIEFIRDIEYNSKSLKLDKALNDFSSNLKEGITYAKQNNTIYTLILFMIGMNFLFHFAYSVPIPFIINKTLNMSSNQFGMIQGLTSGGAFFTSFFIAKKFKRENFRSTLINSIFGMSFVLVAMGLITALNNVFFNEMFTYILFMILSFMFGGLIVTSNISLMTIMQSQAENEYRGRVMAFSSMTRSLITPLSVILSGTILDNIGSYLLPIIGGILLMFSVVLLKVKLNPVECE